MTRDLVIARSDLGALAGVIGLALISSDAILRPASLDEILKRATAPV